MFPHLHWFYQRLSGVFCLLLVPFVWIMSRAHIHLYRDPDYNFKFSSLFVLLLSLILGVAIYHGRLGLHIIIEDYISHKILRHAYIAVVNILSFIFLILLCFSAYSFMKA